MKKDFLAIIYMTSGSSFARGPDKQDCIDRVQKIFVSDWSSLFDVGGKEATVAIYEVTDHDRVYWDHNGVHAEDADRQSHDIPLLETVKVTLPKARRR